MISLVELQLLINEYIKSQPGHLSFTLGPLSHRELADVVLTEFLDWIKERQEKEV